MSQPQDASRMDDARDGASATLMAVSSPPRVFRFRARRMRCGIAHVEGAELHHMRTVLRLVGRRARVVARSRGRRASRRDRALRTRPRGDSYRVIVAVAVPDLESSWPPRSSRARGWTSSSRRPPSWARPSYGQSSVRADWFVRPAAERLARWGRLALAASQAEPVTGRDGSAGANRR